MNKKPHDLEDFMSAVTEDMSREYKRIQKRALEDPGTAGDQGEENWAELLRGWLPPTYQIVTKGRILGALGSASPQVDVIVLHPTYPKHLLNKKLYLAGGVAAAFECKVTLKAAHIDSAVKNAVEIKKLLPLRFGTPYKELHSPIIYGLIAHSHNWKSNKSTPEENVRKKLQESDAKNVQHPRQMLDLVCVADITTWVAYKRNWTGPSMMSGEDWSLAKEVYGTEGSAGTTYMRYQSSAVGSLIISLIHKLAWEDKNLRQLAEYFNSANIMKLGRGKNERRWQADIFSQITREKIMSSKLVPIDQDFISKSFHQSRWDEWLRSF